MVNPETPQSPTTPRWVKVSIVAAAIFGLAFSLHMALGGGMSGLHTLHKMG